MVGFSISIKRKTPSPFRMSAAEHMLRETKRRRAEHRFA
jgi:hypothetical protein